MRLLVVSACVAAMATPALACPRHELCVVQPDVSHASEIALVAKPVAIPNLRRLTLTPHDHFTFGNAPPKLDPSQIEMPWIWRALREHVYSRLPSYGEPQRFTLVLSPVVVTTPADTIPGVGLAGTF